MKIGNFKQEWKNFYQKEGVSINVRALDPRKELDKILQILQCKLCNFEAPRLTRKDKGTRDIVGEKKSMIQHYCLAHFSEPMEYFVEEYISGNRCLKCDKEYAFKSNTKKSMQSMVTHMANFICS